MTIKSAWSNVQEDNQKYHIGIIERIIKTFKQNKLFVNIIFALAGLGIVIFYSICGSACNYITGSLSGIDLKYMGILFTVAFIFLQLLKQDLLALLMLSFAVGIEIFLFEYQIKIGIYCPFCLMFALIIISLFSMNCRKGSLNPILLFTVLGFFFIFVWFEGSPVIASEETPETTFGRGAIKFRLYTDYFCGPCNDMEPKLETLITDLVNKDVISITFVDTPIHKETIMYAEYFFFIINAEREFSPALRGRTALFEAAKENIIERDKLEEFLKKKNIRFIRLKGQTNFGLLNRYMKDDRIDATPTLVIIEANEKKVYKGSEEILKAIEILKPSS